MSTPQISRNGKTDCVEATESIDRNHTQGCFVGIVAEMVIAAAPTFRELESLLRDTGLDPRTVLVIQARVPVPDRATIFI